MTSRLPDLEARSRVLVLAPHPDDETLATGGLVQAAREAGAALHVVVATDGDDNPWPQRWIEKRWRIDAAARARWGARRRAECGRALAVLGVDPGAVDHFGWPDQGVTTLLMRDGAAEQRLAERIAAFAPTHVARPAATDAHPDHNALHVLADLALARAGAHDALRMDYLVHGDWPAGADVATLEATPARLDRKREALLTHETQVCLSRERLLRLCERTERYAVAGGAPRLERAGQGWTLPRRGAWRWRPHELLVVLREGTDVHRLRVRAAWRGETVHAVGGGRVVVTGHHDGVTFDVEGLAFERGHAKLQRAGRRLVIYDRDGWHALAQ